MACGPTGMTNQLTVLISFESLLRWTRYKMRYRHERSGLGTSMRQIIAEIQSCEGVIAKVASQKTLQPHSNLPELFHC